MKTKTDILCNSCSIPGI